MDRRMIYRIAAPKIKLKLNGINYNNNVEKVEGRNCRQFGYIHLWLTFSLYSGICGYKLTIGVHI